MPAMHTRRTKARNNPTNTHTLRRLWNAGDLKHACTVANGGSWVTDCAYLPLSRRMVFTSMDRAISTYDMNRRGGEGGG